MATNLAAKPFLPNFPAQIPNRLTVPFYPFSTVLPARFEAEIGLECFFGPKGFDGQRQWFKATAS
jgi:hypothetical protein